MAESTTPMPPAALVARLLSFPDYQRRRSYIAYAAPGRSPNADPPPACTQIYISGPEAGQAASAFYVPLLYHHAGALWVATDLNPTVDPPQRVRCVNPIPCTDLVNIVVADELFTMRRRDVERQIGTVVPFAD